MLQNKSRAAYIALGVGVLSLSFSAMFVRWADAPGPVTAFYRIFFSIFLLFPFFILKLKTNPFIRSRAVIFPLLAGLFTACDLVLWTTSLSYTTASNATLLGNTSPLWVARCSLWAQILFSTRALASETSWRSLPAFSTEDTSSSQKRAAPRLIP
jgi:drug/metabolite transporter (DMT)-like permease